MDSPIYDIADTLFGRMHLTYVCAHAMKILEVWNPPYFVKWTGSPVPTVPEL